MGIKITRDWVAKKDYPAKNIKAGETVTYEIPKAELKASALSEESAEGTKMLTYKIKMLSKRHWDSKIDFIDKKTKKPKSIEKTCFCGVIDGEDEMLTFEMGGALAKDFKKANPEKFDELEFKGERKEIEIEIDGNKTKKWITVCNVTNLTKGPQETLEQAVKEGFQATEEELEFKSKWESADISDEENTLDNFLATAETRGLTDIDRLTKLFNL